MIKTNIFRIPVKINNTKNKQLGKKKGIAQFSFD